MVVLLGVAVLRLLVRVRVVGVLRVLVVVLVLGRLVVVRVVLRLRVRVGVVCLRCYMLY